MFTRILIAAPLAFVVSAAFIGAAIPAYAATAATCTTTPTRTTTRFSGCSTQQCKRG